MTTRSEWRSRIERTTAAASSSSSPLVTTIRPFEARLSRWPARPTRWSAAAMFAATGAARPDRSRRRRSRAPATRWPRAPCSCAILQPVLGLEPRPARERAVMRGDAAVGDPVVEVARQPLGGAAALGEDERRAMRLDQLGDLLERGLPDRVAGRREEVVHGRHYLIEIAGEAGVDVTARVAVAPVRKVHRTRWGSRSPSSRSAAARPPPSPARRAPGGARATAPDARRAWIPSARGSRPRSGSGCGRTRAESLAREQDEQGFGRCDQHVRRPARHRLALRGEGVARAHGHADLGQLQAPPRRPRRGCRPGGRGDFSRCRC